MVAYKTAKEQKSYTLHKYAISSVLMSGLIVPMSKKWRSCFQNITLSGGHNRVVLTERCLSGALCDLYTFDFRGSYNWVVMVNRQSSGAV